MRPNKKAQQILDEGNIVNAWPVDVDPKTGETESNGGQEFEIEFNNKIYIVLTDWEDVAYKVNLKGK